jgi:hypothetical protein
MICERSDVIRVASYKLWSCMIIINGIQSTLRDEKDEILKLQAFACYVPVEYVEILNIEKRERRYVISI